MRVIWTPTAPNELFAVRDYGPEWERVPGQGEQTFAGVVCVMIQPPSLPSQARWADKANVRDSQT